MASRRKRGLEKKKIQTSLPICEKKIGPMYYKLIVRNGSNLILTKP